MGIMNNFCSTVSFNNHNYNVSDISCMQSIDSLVAQKVSEAMAAMRPPPTTVLPPLIASMEPLVIPVLSGSSTVGHPLIREINQVKGMVDHTDRVLSDGNGG